MHTYRAVAKINVGLHVLGKRADGYHAIATVFLPIELYDAVTIEAADTISVLMRPSLGIAETDNLAYRAARLLRDAAGIRTGAKITITKHIPAGSGLGGGSSDAATSLLGLCRLWDCALSRDELSELALQLGSDVPYFLDPRPTYAEGRGELLTTLPPMRQRTVLVVAPSIHISTAWAYAQVKSHSEHVRPRLLRDALLTSESSDELLRSVCTNDFEQIVFAAYPRLAEIKEALYAAGATYASLTGSGSALFGFFDDRNTAISAAVRFPDCRTFVTQTLTTVDYRR